MRDIAKSAGIKPSSIYNHFDSKQDILNEIYSYFRRHMYYSMRWGDELKKLIMVCSPREFIESLHCSFDKEGPENYARMNMIMKIIYTRIFKDDTAREIMMVELGSVCIDMTKDVLDYAIKAGRLEPIDTYTFSSCFIDQLHMMGIKAFTNPSHLSGFISEEIKIKELFAKMLKFNEIGDDNISA